jgi:tetratricopeptide (TPR) repeat protein
MAIALAGGSALGMGALSAPAQAQDYQAPPPPPSQQQMPQQPPPQRQRQQQQSGETLSRNFQPLYLAVSEATNTTGDYAGARAQVPALVAAIATEYDRFFAGNIMLQLGSKASDKALQRQGLELMLASGRATPENANLFRFLIGSFKYDAADYAGALSDAQAALAAGYPGDFANGRDPWGLIADTYFKLNRHQEGIAFLKDAYTQRKAAGQPVRDEWLLGALAVAYQQNLMPQASELSAMVVESSPTPANWAQALQVVGAMTGNDVQARLDLFRLMALTGSLSERREYESYVAILDPRVLASEAGKVLDAGVQRGVFTTGDPFYTESKGIIATRAAQEAGLAAEYAAEAASASNGRAALNAGDVYLSLGQYAKAEEMFALASQKGGVDRDTALTRLGIAQVQQQKLAEAKSTFAQVSGVRAPLARMWNAYIASRG